MSDGAVPPTGRELLPRRGHPAPPDLVERRRAVEELAAARPLPPDVDLVETEAGGVPALELLPRAATGPAVVLYFHGGGYRMGSIRSYASFTAHLAAACGTRVLSIDYRVAPENPFPAALADAAAAYRSLPACGTPAGSIVVAVDSAGGGVAAALLLYLAQVGLPAPAGAALLSPWADLRNVADAFTRCAATDELFSKRQADEAAGFYLAGHPAEDPLASPALGSWRGAPPLLVQASDAEVLSDDAALLARTARAAGVAVDHEVYPGVPHVWHLQYPALPAATRAVERVAAFVARVTAGPAHTLTTKERSQA